MVVFEKFVSSKRGTFWIYIVRYSFWKAEVVLQVPHWYGKKTVWRKIFFFPFAAPLITISARLAEAFTV